MNNAFVYVLKNTLEDLCGGLCRLVDGNRKDATAESY